MIRHFFLDKTNTISTNSERNMGLNPILGIGYGCGIMRGLIHFDLSEIKNLIDDKTFANIDKLTFTLKMTNCFSLDNISIDKTLFKGVDKNGKRASSFDLMLCKLPIHFDAGRGFDSISDLWEHNNSSFINSGSNWYCCKSGMLWNGQLRTINVTKSEGGIWNNDELWVEYKKFLKGEESIIVGTQHFDYGFEHLSIDITRYVLDCLSTSYDSNYGLCLMFTPNLEDIKTDDMQCVNFFTDNTNSFFHPYVEAKYEEYIEDDRSSFTIGTYNKLYLYVMDDGMPINLDEIPNCEISGKKYEVKQSSKGIYYAIIPPYDINTHSNSIEYDTWSNIKINGVVFDDVEMEFVTKSSDNKFSIGHSSENKNNLVPSLYGINDWEKVCIGDVRKIVVDFRKKYSTDKKVLMKNGEYRLYIKDGNREIDVIEFQPIEKAFLENFFILHTSDLIPNDYFIDIKVKTGNETFFFKESLRFTVVNNVTNRIQ